MLIEKNGLVVAITTVEHVYISTHIFFRLVKAYADLKATLESEADLKENEDYITAEQILKEAEAQLPEPV